MNDHCAFDAYSLLVEADGRRLFHTGDIRGHGRKAGIFEQLLRVPPSEVDVLLMEGTNIRPEEEPDVAESTDAETDVKLACADLFRTTSGMALAMYSAQNFDRLVTLFRAAKRTGRTFVMTLYGASIAVATGNDNIPPKCPKKNPAAAAPCIVAQYGDGMGGNYIEAWLPRTTPASGPSEVTRRETPVYARREGRA
jgi:mRNA degradation ribonuclease J1/J2